MTARQDAVVIGAGIIGLTTAMCLLEEGWGVRVVCAAAPLDTTSAVAAAIWYPYGVAGERVLAWAAATHETFRAQATVGAGIEFRRGRELFRLPTPDPEWAPLVGGVTHPALAAVPSPYVDAHEFTAPIVDMPVYLEWLARRLVARGAVIDQVVVTSLDQFGPDKVVMNCAGLGASALADDESLVAVRGQVVRVRNPGITTFVRDDGNPAGRTYVYPRAHDCILGGTAERGNRDLAPDPNTTQRILRECRRLEPRLEGAEVLQTLVGLRPWRPTVRLEVERRAAPGAVVVHNYGHGGAGVTLSWGCAREAVQLATYAGL